MGKTKDLNLELVIEEIKSLELMISKEASTFAQTRNVLKQILDLKNLLTDSINSKDSVFQLNKMLNELGIALSELDFEIEDDQVRREEDLVKPEFLLKAYDLIDGLHKKTSDQLSSLEDIFAEFMSLSQEEQIELLVSDIPHSQFLKFQDQMNDKVRMVLFVKLASSPYIEVNESFLEALKYDFFALKLAETTKQDSILLELLSLKNSNVEMNLVKRFEELDLLAYWGLFSIENRKELVKQIHNIEEFKRIEPFLIYHATLDEATACWTEILSKSWADEVLQYLLENESKYMKLNSRYPDLFKKQLINEQPNA